MSTLRLQTNTALARVSTQYAAVTIACVVLDLVAPPAAGLTIASILFLTWSIVLGLRDFRQCALRINPLVAYQAWLAATLGVSTIWTATHYAEMNSVPFGPRNIALASVAQGHAVMVVGACAMYIGMRLSHPSERLVGAKSLVPQSTGLLMFLALLGGAAYVLREPLTEAVGSTITNFIAGFALAVACVAMINPPGVVRGFPGGRATVAAASAPVLLFLYAQRDSKMDIMFAFFPLLWWLILKRVSGWQPSP